VFEAGRKFVNPETTRALVVWHPLFKKQRAGAGWKASKSLLVNPVLK
jgi:hypothetical protein